MWCGFLSTHTMASRIRRHDLTVSDQIRDMQHRYPNFQRVRSDAGMSWTGQLIHGWAPLFVRVQAETALAVYMDDLKIFFRDLQLGVPDPNLWGMVTAVGNLDRICNA
jgi:hypothetical protein